MITNGEGRRIGVATWLAAIFIYYVSCCVLALLFGLIQGDFGTGLDAKDFVFMLFLGWFQMLMAVAGVSFLGGPEPMQWAMIVSLFVTWGVMRWAGRR